MAKKLGRGLAALLGDISISNDKSDSNPLLIEIDNIYPNNYNCRNNANDNNIQELADSISMHGIIQPIVIKETEENKYIIISGERRWKAAKLIGLTKIPSIIVNVDEKECRVLSLIDNYNRLNINPIDEANTIKYLIDNYKCSINDISIIICKKRHYINSVLGLLTLSEEIQQFIKDGLIEFNNAVQLVGLENAIELAELIIRENLSPSQTEQYLRRLKNPISNNKYDDSTKSNIVGTPILPIRNEESEEIANRIEKAINIPTKLVITRSGGKLTILCKTYEELDKIVNKLISNDG
ncbi:MAG: ParB/RepB/Spo0J family partition protein [Alphaproteobacteria bacterium]|nr:ParB/RepB/Spo0J family partition protein [Alphaproteobacteria bacterium]